jgi:hypothetical protein
MVFCERKSGHVIFSLVMSSRGVLIQFKSFAQSVHMLAVDRILLCERCSCIVLC